ncbi:MAG: chorismate synthase, partial [Planctomycetes bacterium]|nr:chorismate synthase [Planctomycetota bacterium]
MLRFTTAGESHGAAVIATLEGLPAGFKPDVEAINDALRRRQGGYGRGARMRIESDTVTFLAGLRGGVTLGSPIVMQILNKDAKLERLGEVTKARPAHADLAGALKYGTADARNVLERASARETAARTMVGALCADFLSRFGVSFTGYVRQLGTVNANGLDPLRPFAKEDRGAIIARRNDSDFYTVDNAHDDDMRQAVDRARQNGDTLGGVVEVLATGVPPGLGNCTQWDRKLDAKIAQALLSVQAVKAVEIGAGRDAADQQGSALHDTISRCASGPTAYWEFGKTIGITRGSNNAGGIEGGMSNGAPLVVRVTKKPISTLMRPLPTIDLVTGEEADAAVERSDVCALPAASVVLENAMAVPVAEAFL